MLRAERDGDHYILNGTKHYIANGGVAGLYFLLARTEGWVAEDVVEGLFGRHAVIIGKSAIIDVGPMP